VPFLKFSRDRRGYEHFAIVEPGVPRRGKPARQRVLFWFRTPPQVKVGRLPFTDDVRRAIEAQNPGIRFDWPRLLATPIPPPDVEHWRERRRAEKAAKQAAREAGVDEAGAVEEVAATEEEPAAERTLQAYAVVEAEESRDAVSTDQEPGQTAPASGTSQVGAAGGHRRRRRGRRRRPHSSEPGSAPAQTAQITPAPPPPEEV
jgi:pyruvate/2-oxoglutarate dehydrogenase complex dihydrolipoamide acyltransferase (E2) component